MRDAVDVGIAADDLAVVVDVVGGAAVDPGGDIS